MVNVTADMWRSQDKRLERGGVRGGWAVLSGVERRLSALLALLRSCCCCCDLKLPWTDSIARGHKIGCVMTQVRALRFFSLIETGLPRLVDSRQF